MVDAKGEYRHGKWMAFIKRAIKSPSAADTQFEIGRVTPLAIAVWDGTNGEKGPKHTFSGWFFVGLKPHGKGGCF